MKNARLLISDFLNYFEIILGNSEKASKIYKCHLEIFFRFISRRFFTEDEKVDFEKIDYSKVDLEIIKNLEIEDIYAYIMFCDRELKNSNGTKRKKSFTIKGFFKYLKEKGYIDEDITIDLKVAKEGESAPIYMTLEESKQLLNTIDGRYKERDYAIVALFLNCGMRLSELVQINIDDIRGDILTVIGKGNKERTVYLNKMCLDALESYLNVRPNVKTKALFISSREQRVANRTIQNMMTKYVKQAGLSEDYSIHKLRHTSATLLYKYGNVDIRTLQRILGHSNVATTQIYTHVDDEQLREAVNKNPLI